MAELPYMTYLLLSENLIMFILNCLTFGLLFRTFYTKIKLVKNSEISPQFLVYLISVFAMAFINGIKSGYAICVWFNGTNDPFIIYVTSIAGLIILPVVSLAVFFLVLHRTLIITRFITHSNIHQFLLFLSYTIMAILSIVTLINYVFVWDSVEKPAPNNCVSVDCVTRTSSGTNLSIWAKLITGSLNVLISIWFFYEFQKSQKICVPNNSTDRINKKKTNKLTLLTITLEIVLNFLPAFVDLILRRTINFSLSQYLGVYATFCGSIEGFLVAIIYSNMFAKMKVSNIPVRITTKILSTKNDVSVNNVLTNSNAKISHISH